LNLGEETGNALPQWERKKYRVRKVPIRKRGTTSFCLNEPKLKLEEYPEERSKKKQLERAHKLVPGKRKRGGDMASLESGRSTA